MDDYPLLYSDGEDIVGTVDGTNYRILESLGAWLNFTFTLTYTAEDGKWGELENGTTWNGMLGEIYNGHKNITVNYFTVVEERLRYFDVTTPYFYEGFGFALRVPQPLPAWMNLTYPFSPLVWVSVCVVLLLTAPTLYLVTRLASSPSVNIMSLQDAALVVFGVRMSVK